MTRRSLEVKTRRSLEITVMDVKLHTDTELVKRVMEKYGEVRRCEWVTMHRGPWTNYDPVKVNQVKVELVRNKEKLPNIIQAPEGASWLGDTWKLKYPGCFGCGGQCPSIRRCRTVGARKLEKVSPGLYSTLLLYYTALCTTRSNTILPGLG